MNAHYRLDWLRPDDARAAAAVERRLYARADRLGQRHIHEDLTEAEADGGNLSVALYRGARLVGYLLAYREADRRNPAAYLGIEIESAADSGPAVFIVDLAVLPAHRSQVPRLFAQFNRNVANREDVRQLPLEAFSIPHYADHWAQHPRFLGRLGVRLVARQPFRDERRGRDLFWLTFERITASAAERVRHARIVLRSPEAKGDLTVGVVDTQEGWHSLEPHWDRLLRATPGFTVFQTCAYLQTWWQHLGWPGRLFILVACRDGQPVAISPMQVSHTRWLGQETRCLGFIGQPSEIDRPTVLAPSDEHEAIRAIADYLMTHREWDCMVLQEQASESLFVRALTERLAGTPFHVSWMAGQECLYAQVAGTWQAYLGGKSRSFRKGLRRKVSQLDERGVRFETGIPDEPTAALDRYLAVEESSWKAAAGLGAGRSSAHRAFNRTLLSGAVPGAQPVASFLRTDEATIAATFGLLFERRFYSLHITHDSRWNDFSPGVVLTARELEHSFNERAYDVFDFLGGFPTNKRTWATGAVTTSILYVDSPGWRGWLFHWIYFTVKPVLRRALIRSRLLEPLKRAQQAFSRARATSSDAAESQ